ncbi:hypothetical protein ACU686_01405 [Yinghuangia aomiensis]
MRRDHVRRPGRRARRGGGAAGYPGRPGDEFLSLLAERGFTPIADPDAMLTHASCRGGWSVALDGRSRPRCRSRARAAAPRRGGRRGFRPRCRRRG